MITYTDRIYFNFVINPIYTFLSVGLPSNCSISLSWNIGFKKIHPWDRASNTPILSNGSPTPTKYCNKYISATVRIYFNLKINMGVGHHMCSLRGYVATWWNWNCIDRDRGLNFIRKDSYSDNSNEGIVNPNTSQGWIIGKDINNIYYDYT